GDEALPLEGVGVSDWPTPNPSRRREGDRGSTSRRAWPGQPGASLRRVRADAGEEARVGVEQAVPALRLVRRVAHVGEVAVAEAGVGVGGAGFAVPGPEVAAHDRATGAPRGFDRLVDHRVVLLAEGGRRAGGVDFLVAREAEFLDQQRLAELGGEALVRGEIGRDFLAA